jgi:Protein of unknown function (DUF760)
MLAYYLEMEPSLFESAVDDQFSKIKEQRDKRSEEVSDAEAAAANSDSSESTDLVLPGLQERIQGAMEKEWQATVEDLMYLCAPCLPYGQLCVFWISNCCSIDNWSRISCSGRPDVRAVRTGAASVCIVDIDSAAKCRCILQEFMKLGIGMLPRLDNYTALESVTLEPLMDGVHTKEALKLARAALLALQAFATQCQCAAIAVIRKALHRCVCALDAPVLNHASQAAVQTCTMQRLALQVREHMMNLLGQTVLMPPTATLKMSKLQMVQVYGASVMFGYFLRRADSRFQLARRTGMLPEDKEDAVARLERIFSLVRRSCSPILVYVGSALCKASCLVEGHAARTQC